MGLRRPELGFFEEDPKITAFSAGAVNPDTPTNGIDNFSSLSLRLGAAQTGTTGTNVAGDTDANVTTEPNLKERFLQGLPDLGGSATNQTETTIENGAATTSGSGRPTILDTDFPGTPVTGPEDVSDIPDVSGAPGVDVRTDGITTDDKTRLDLANKASDALDQFISGETPDRFARQSRDQFTRFASAQTDALQAENERLIMSGQISSAEGAARIDSFIRGLSSSRGELETSITENRERIIKENIGEVSKFLESQIRIDNVTGVIESRQINDIINSVFKGVVSSAAGRVLISDHFTALVDKGIIDPVTGKLADEFKTPSGIEQLIQERVDAGIPRDKAEASVKFIVTAPDEIAKFFFEDSAFKQFDSGLILKDALFEKLKISDPTLTPERFEEKLAAHEQKTGEGELDISFKTAVATPFGLEADKLIAGEGRTAENAAAFDTSLEDVVNERVKDMTSGAVDTASIDKKDASDPVYKALFDKSTNINAFFTKSTFSKDLFEFGTVIKNGTFIKAGDKLFKVVSDVKTEKDSFPDPGGANIFGVVEQVDSQFVEVLDVTTGKTFKVFASQFRK